MLPAVDRNCNAGDAFCLRKIEHRGSDVVRPRAALKRQALRLRRNCTSVWRGLGSVGPGATALTRIFGANACANVVVAVWSALLLKRVGEKARIWLKHALIEDIDDRCIDPAGACAAKACERNSGAARLTATARWKRACDRVSISSGSNSPALLTRSVSWPNAAGRGNKAAHCLLLGEIGKNNAGASAAPVIAGQASRHRRANYSHAGPPHNPRAQVQARSPRRCGGRRR